MIKWIKKKTKWFREKERIRQLREDLISLGDFPSQDVKVFEYAVKFFQVIADFQDNGMIWNAPDRLLDEQILLDVCIWDTGRNQFGINRTKPNETVTLDNTYWGTNLVFASKSSRYWIEDESIYEDFRKQFNNIPSWYEDNPRYCKIIADFQIRPFILNNLSKILQVCNKLLGNRSSL